MIDSIKQIRFLKSKSRIIYWKEDYSVNIKEIDQQHKKLIDMLNLVYDSCIRDEKDDILEQVISDMIDYAFVHFKVSMVRK